jgi:hypothetical protein
MLSHRLQILLDDDRHRRLVAEAERRSVPVAVVVRDALDRALASNPDERRAALAAILAAEPMPVPDDPADVKREIAESRSHLAS